MARYRMDDDTVVDTRKSVEHWEDETDWDGNNHIHRTTRSQWQWQVLYKSSKGRYYIVHGSAYQGSLPHAEWLSHEEATRWLLLNGYDLPEDLHELADEVSE